MHTVLRASSIVVLSFLVLACCFGGSGAASNTTRLDPWGVELDHGSFVGGALPDGSYLFTSSDGSSTLTVSAALPGVPAASRQPTDLLGHAANVQWTRPRTYAGMSGIEARVNDTAQGQVHWIGAFDAPTGAVVVLRLSTSTQWIDTPTRGDPGWETLALGVRRGS
jgi:hypothetical protein